MTRPVKFTRIWDEVEQTDPKFTKRASKGGSHEFTAIDPYYQIRRATEMFGPVGLGWGWNLVEARREASVAYVIIELWYKPRDENGNAESNGSFIVFGETALYGKPSQDEDALKKALTDAITKGLSYLGFSADVYLGKFDDNKYVEQLRKATSGMSLREAQGHYQFITNAIVNAKSIEDLTKIRDQHRETVSMLPKKHKEELVKWLAERMEQLKK